MVQRDKSYLHYIYIYGYSEKVIRIGVYCPLSSPTEHTAALMKLFFLSRVHIFIYTHVGNKNNIIKYTYVYIKYKLYTRRCNLKVDLKRKQVLLTCEDRSKSKLHCFPSRYFFFNKILRQYFLHFLFEYY